MPIDLRKLSLNALDTAVALSKKHKATIYILHVSETVQAPADSQKNMTVLPFYKHRCFAGVDKCRAAQNEFKPLLIEEEGNLFEVIQ